MAAKNSWLHRREFLGLSTCWKLSALIAMMFSSGTHSTIVSVSAFCPVPRITGSRRQHSDSRQVMSLSPSTAEAQATDLKADMETVKHLTETAIYETSSINGLEALQSLSLLCQQRLPYVFPTESQTEQKEKATSSADISNDRNGNADGISWMRKWSQLFSSDAIASIMAQIQEMEENGWWSTNPDSVDGLPSFHLNLVSDGKPLFPVKDDRKGKDEDDNRDFEKEVQTLLQVVHPVIYEDLLPKLQQEWLASSIKSTSLQVSDIFVRRYGRELEDAGIEARQGISAHYDVYSKVTAVVALDDVAAAGTNGLYTTYSMPEEGCTSISTNHAALRRFVPLREGDSVLHTWDILHGVDVEPGLDRTSLIVWFTEAAVLDQDEEGGDNDVDPSQADKNVAPPVVSPWLLRNPNLESDDVAQFVLASALSSSNIDNDENGTKSENDDQQNEKDYQHHLYIRSAANRNSFALTRIGSLIEEGALCRDLLEQVKGIADQLRPFEELPVPIQKWQHDSDESSLLAMRFWLEGAVRGNPLAQKALADELMFLQSSQHDHDPEVNTLAASLFALAAQQGDEEASDSLARVIDFAAQVGDVQSQEEFLALEAVTVAKAATSYRDYGGGIWRLE